MRPTCSARSLSSLARRRQPLVSIPSRLLHSSPRLSAEVVPSPTIAADSSSSSSPSSSSSSSSSAPLPSWPRPLPEGKVEAFDLALEFLRARHVELEALKANEAKVPFAYRRVKGVDRLGVPVHDPEARWQWEQGLADPMSPSSTYFEREKFELGGGLDLHEARINQMHVVPDVANVRELQLDFGFKYPLPPPPPAPEPDIYGLFKKVRDYQTRDPKDGNRVVCGAKLTVRETLSQPELEIRHFGRSEPEEKYTLMMLDLDGPDIANHSYDQKIHWLVPNITINPTTRIFPSPDFPPSPSAKHVATLPEPLHTYLPPHPHMGTGYHRYAFLLLKHLKDIPFGAKKFPIPPRDGFNFRKWALRLKHRSRGVQVAGLSFFRETYDEVLCPQIWKELIGRPEPIFKVDGSSNRHYLDRFGRNKAAVLTKKKLREARDAAPHLPVAAEADTVSTSSVVREKVFAKEDSTVAKATGEENVESAVVEVKKEDEKPVIRRWRRGVDRKPKEC